MMKNLKDINTAINDSKAAQNIMDLTECFISSVDPLKILLFGSFANGTYTDSSDYDFYIVIDDDKNIFNTSFLANKSVRDIMERPIDIVVGTNSRFQKFGKSKDSLMIEGEVQRNGILLYDSAGAAN
ncbi:MAG: nucleotidyltransferase domain-containing protein [Anaerolineaceae bacterium]|nr:nucleotidyltransferase domain-containing protein [Anaerolineaceae bacterium]